MINVLSICQDKIPSALIGIINPFERLTNHKDYSEKIQFQFKRSYEVTAFDIRDADILISIRGADPLELSIVKECKRLKKFIIYFLDDDLLNVPKEAECSIYFENELIRKSISEIISLSDVLWTNNYNIAKKYKCENQRVFISKIIFEPTSDLNYEAVKNIVYSKNNNSDVLEQKQPVRIGFAGGIDHSKFLDVIVGEAIEIIHTKYKNQVEFEFFGAKPNIAKKLSLKHFSYEKNYEEYINKIKSRKWDFAIAPILETEFHKCKYYNKYLEYSSLGIAGIYTETEPFSFIINNRANGILVKNTTQDWVDAMEEMINDVQLRLRIIEASINNIKEQFNENIVLMDIIENLPELTYYNALKVTIDDVIEFPARETSFFWSRVKTIFRNHGIKTPIYITKKIIEKVKYL